MGAYAAMPGEMLYQMMTLAQGSQRRADIAMISFPAFRRRTRSRFRSRHAEYIRNSRCRQAALPLTAGADAQ